MAEEMKIPHSEMSARWLLSEKIMKSPPRAWIDWRTMMLMWKLTTFDSFAASALRREVSSPVSFRSKKAISWRSKLLKSFSRSRATTRAPAIQKKAPRRPVNAAAPTLKPNSPRMALWKPGVSDVTMADSADAEKCGIATSHSAAATSEREEMARTALSADAKPRSWRHSFSVAFSFSSSSFFRVAGSKRVFAHLRLAPPNDRSTPGRFGASTEVHAAPAASFGPAAATDRATGRRG
mmetsp:Transcript_21993/g.56271  ORF Transcript_21993/g.56271 Transcript_21993/m.56271 type:complete len:237 (+) Transcript_21993:539-1249(+)